jgi:hypothetical protein
VRKPLPRGDLREIGLSTPTETCPSPKPNPAKTARAEQTAGWLKTIAWIRKVKRRGLANVEWLFVFASAAFNLIRLPRLLPKAA